MERPGTGQDDDDHLLISSFLFIFFALELFFPSPFFSPLMMKLNIVQSDPRSVASEVPADLFFANQVITNACATQAILAILMNAEGVDVTIPQMQFGLIFFLFYYYYLVVSPLLGFIK